ncbi:MAG TPA: hypothetical protein VGV64_07745 [Thermoplasmata archaeon]|nr:hypothetical protein [Thermoplasmata archaeon]
MDGGVERPPDSGRVSRQRLIVLGVVLTLLGGLILLLAPDLTGPLVHDLPFLGGCLVSLFLGGILLGVGYGRKPPRPPR